MEIQRSGQLSELPVVSLIQEICKHSGTFVLHIRSDRNEIGTLTFTEGELLNADYGNLHGEAAMAELLHWQNGTFSVTERQPIGPSNKMATNGQGTYFAEYRHNAREERMNSLVAEISETDQTIMDAEATAEEREIEYFLIGLLSKLERYQSSSRAEADAGNLNKVINTVGIIIDETTQFINERQKRLGRTLSLKNVVKEIGIRQESAYLFSDSDRTLNTRNAIAVLKQRHLSHRERTALEQDIKMAMVAILAFLFGLILDLFSTDAVTLQWQQNFQLTLGDIRQVLDI